MVNAQNMKLVFTEVQLQRIKEGVIAELLSSGGVDYDRAALELMYYIPDQFKAIYTTIFHEALQGADGNTNARGASGAETGALGKAPGKTAGGSKRKFKGTWFVNNEEALKIKENADKRLRQLARDMQEQYDDMRSRRIGTVNSAKGLAQRQELDAEIRESTDDGKTRRTCNKCFKFLGRDWRYCPSCGEFCQA